MPIADIEKELPEEQTDEQNLDSPFRTDCIVLLGLERLLIGQARRNVMDDRRSLVLERVDDQIGWYDGKSQSAQSWFKRLKFVQLATAGLIPLVAVFEIPHPDKVMAVLGLVILIVEGLQQLNQYQTNWISYRSTCEALRHEKLLFLVEAGPYADVEDPIALLADRGEGLISQEHAKWLSARERVTEDAKTVGKASEA